MADVTLRVWTGPIGAASTNDLPTPVTIGREEGNTVQLNDERISRFHIKIQEDQGKLVLTDLESTNGTRVNGEDVQLRILRFGDVISLGRSVLLYGTREQIVGRLDELREDGLERDRRPRPGEGVAARSIRRVDFEVALGRVGQSAQHAAHSGRRRSCPTGLSPGQAAQLSEMLRVPASAEPHRWCNRSRCPKARRT